MKNPQQVKFELYQELEKRIPSYFFESSKVSNEDFIKHLKELASDLVLPNGELAEAELTVSGVIIGWGLDPRKLNFVRELLNLLLNTRYTSLATKIYLSNSSMEYHDVFVELDNLGKIITEKRVVSQILHDCSNIMHDFGGQIIINLRKHDNNRMSEAEGTLDMLKSRFRKINVFENLVMPLSEVEECRSLPEEEWKDILIILMPYLKSQIKAISESLPLASIGYIRYLVNNKSTALNEIDNERKNWLLTLLGKVE